MDDQSTVFTSPYLAATACCCPGRLGRTASGPGCSTPSGGAPQPLRPQGQLMVVPYVAKFAAFDHPGTELRHVTLTLNPNPNPNSNQAPSCATST